MGPVSAKAHPMYRRKQESSLVPLEIERTRLEKDFQNQADGIQITYQQLNHGTAEGSLLTPLSLCFLFHKMEPIPLS